MSFANLVKMITAERIRLVKDAVPDFNFDQIGNSKIGTVAEEYENQTEDVLNAIDRLNMKVINERRDLT